MKQYIILLIVSFLLISGTGFTQAQNTNLQTMIQIKTSLGTIKIALYNETPLHRDNMIKLVKEGYYTDHLFHRVIKDFMIQGGDPGSVGAEKGKLLGNGGPGYTISAEFNNSLFHKKGALAAARLGDDVNPDKESSGSQFYIVQGRVFTIQELKTMEARGTHRPFSQIEIDAYTTTGGTPPLDGGYTVYGEIIEGMDVVEKISLLPTDRFNRPVEDVVFSIMLIGE